MPSNIIEPRRGAAVGRVVVELVVENFDDVNRAARGEIPLEAIRRASVAALVDSGATYLCLPRATIAALGLAFQRSREARTITGTFNTGMYAAARVSAEGRDCVTEVMEIPDGRQPLLGQVPLEMMDFWIDMTAQKLVGNPEHGGEAMAEVM